ncbi:MAG: carbohydrate ABC transporter permease [Sphaerochaeta sp.]|nr:carbohydrate ABC transporter permease [Sphaerochaeta sp.]MDD4301793.1 carbohydrate ABC transporter permease [Sphaerochaeta sp.]MDD4647668.1 carbohydrate ABC transporter permease [Sphaerochaeta sp.]MDY0243612.1 carbohydrate ABC transporter permease [Sphaerochaeta sp.]
MISLARKRQNKWTMVVNIVLIVLVIIWSIPIIGLLISSLRPQDDVLNTGWWTIFKGDGDFTLNNYRRVLGGSQATFTDAEGNVLRASGDNLSQAFINSFTVTIPSVIIPILIATAAAFGFAWMVFPGRKLFFTIVVALLVVPLQISLIPILRDYMKIGLTGSYLGIWLAHTGFGLPLGIYLLYNYVSTIPRDVFESAFLDGARPMVIFVRLVLPLSVPAIASLGIFQFLWVWNDLLVALVFLGGTSDVAVLTQRLANMVGSRGQDWHLLTAGAFIVMIVPILVFFFLQRYFVQGLMAGSVKG